MEHARGPDIRRCPHRSVPARHRGGRRNDHRARCLLDPQGLPCLWTRRFILATLQLTQSTARLYTGESTVNIHRLLALSALILLGSPAVFAQTDPGVRGGAAGAGQPFSTLTANEREFFLDGQADFNEAEGVADGLGPR